MIEPAPDSSLYQRIYDLVRQVPPGKVISYGQVAQMVGGCSARTVGYAMAALKSGRHPDVPWQRVINSQGRISITGFGRPLQQELLENEGVEFNDDHQVDWVRFGWVGRP